MSIARLVILQFINQVPRFHVAYTKVGSLEEARKEFEDDNCETLVTELIDLDLDDPAIRAIAAILELVIEASDPRRDHLVAAEALLLKIFMAGRATAQG